ncbi:septal ring lytic transglycosylase RlpA family protein [Micromonospora peucetia]|uniref:Probable endolytic peptidoglycan transglycosylase RlpA n=1 Tax=Micromonospora peucetia TaxID=47871 RepID=A0A1C6UUQ1_9ACTN|nr:septal ring lytic transglycosylase RlpA family protein [Micromonospora peucetia]MCX4387532.1 septal ring lytic transglycosylase RlpA family protein [Micromonospora peucetia]WSA34856.1 septal ring lytic transglycosylase RlpA family protein [Micromonospora peucetia]SCL57728.1 rare lipoprotein A [Micromonospora peucetia]
MAGRHSRTRMFSSPAGIAATAAVGVALVVGGTVGAVQLTSGAETARPAAVDLAPTSLPSSVTPSTPAAPPSVSASPSTTASPKVTRSTQAPSRSKPRTAAPKPTATKKSSTARPVVDSGSCGASFYSEGQLTANGENFDPSALTAAHKTLPFGTKVRVTNPANGKSVTVRINDRGPFIEGRCLDLSRAAFADIASLDAGHVEVRYEVLG